MGRISHSWLTRFILYSAGAQSPSPRSRSASAMACSPSRMKWPLPMKPATSLAGKTFLPSRLASASPACLSSGRVLSVVISSSSFCTAGGL